MLSSTLVDPVAPLEAAPPGRAWTVMVYLDGDNNLEPYALADLNEMEAVLLPDSVTVVVEMDLASTVTKIGVVQYDPANSSSIVTPLQPVVPAPGNSELDMADPATLTGFIQYATSTYTASNYALVLWDHGGGLSGVCWDDTGGDNLPLSVQEVGAALAAAGTHLGVVGFDACLAGMFEQAYELKDVTDVVVGSEQLVPGNGWNYTGVLGRLAADPAMGAEAFGSAIVADYGATYGRNQTMSATRTSAFADLAAKLSAFSDAALAGRTADWSALLTARSKTPYFYDSSYRDLATFMSKVASGGANVDIRNAAQAVVAAATGPGGAIFANYSGPKSLATGLSIYLPAFGQGTVWLSRYNATNYALANDTTWDEFVNVLVTKKSGGGKPGKLTGRSAEVLWAMQDLDLADVIRVLPRL